MKSNHRVLTTLSGSIAIAALAISAGAAPRLPSLAITEDKAQLTMDETALAREKARLEADRARLAEDDRSGKMSALSTDSAKIYADEQAIEGQRKVIPTDKPGSLQMSTDQAALQREEAQLRLDQSTLKADTRAGKMAAMSADEMRIYQDQQGVTALQQIIVEDRLKLRADGKT